jgi:hypothetical protein
MVLMIQSRKLACASKEVGAFTRDQAPVAVAWEGGARIPRREVRFDRWQGAGAGLARAGANAARGGTGRRGLLGPGGRRQPRSAPGALLTWIGSRSKARGTAQLGERGRWGMNTGEETVSGVKDREQPGPHSGCAPVAWAHPLDCTAGPVGLLPTRNSEAPAISALAQAGAETREAGHRSGGGVGRARVCRTPRGGLSAWLNLI